MKPILSKLFMFLTLILLALSGCQASPKARSTLKKSRQNGSVVLDGKPIPVYWDDGDTFEFRMDGRKIRARLKGFNTLESYGPVHSWGTWQENELYEIAFEATAHAKRGVWECNKTNQSGGYGRILVDCPELRTSLLANGLAHVFWLNESAPEDILKHQHDAMRLRKGMWQKGVPNAVLTGIHSANEENLPDPYNRLASTQNGEARASTHSKRYKTCQKVCEENSCMLYVPYTNRYGKHRAKCLISR